MMYDFKPKKTDHNDDRNERLKNGMLESPGKSFGNLIVLVDFFNDEATFKKFQDDPKRHKR